MWGTRRLGTLKRIGAAMVAVVVALLGLGGVMAVRTASLTSRQLSVEKVTVDVEPGVAARRLATATTFATISKRDDTWRPGEEFARLHAWLRATYPRAFEALEVETVNEGSLLLHWKGRDPELGALVLMAHLDVVPVEEETLNEWTHPPFAGVIDDGWVWGRGTLDQKLGVITLLEAVTWQLERGFEPERSIYLAFGHDEEATGRRGAKAIAQRLAERDIDVWIVLDEGGFRVGGDQALTGVETAYVAIAEKGYLTLELTASSAGGHSSAPVEPTSIGRLSRAIATLESHPFPASLDGPVRYMLEYTAPHMDTKMRMAVANRWLLGGLLRKQFEASPTGRASIRTTIAPTIIEGGVKDNVLPQTARAVVNFRIHGSDSVDAVITRVKEVIDDDGVEIRVVGNSAEPSPVTNPEGEGYQLLARTIGEVTTGDVLVIPWASIGATDSRHFTELTDQVLRYSHAKLQAGDARRIHGVDERVALEEVDEQVRFYVRFIENAGGASLP